MKTHEANPLAIPHDVMLEATQLARAAKILPGSVTGLALKIQAAREQNRPLRVKLGVDPTSSQLHLGHTVVLRRLRRFQDFGHQAVLIIGGFTAQIGDPSGRDTTRPALTPDAVRENGQTFLEQVKFILDMERTEVVNNADWLNHMMLPELLELASHMSVNHVMSRFKDRLTSNKPFALHELIYPLLQGFDSVHLKADVELGGEDQLSNLLMGRDLQPIKGQEPQVVLMLPLLEGTDGVRKMSKSFGNAIALTDNPDDILAKCMRLPDTLVGKFFELTTALDEVSLARELALLAEGGNPRDAKERLAKQLINELHSDPSQADGAIERWRKQHSERQVPDEMPTHVVSEAKDVVTLLVETGMAPSRTKAAKLVQQDGVRIDGEKATGPNQLINVAADKPVVLQVGRRQFTRLTAS